MSNVLVRARGKSFQLHVKHRLLDAPIYRTFASQLEAELAGRRALEDLHRGQMAHWLKAPADSQFPTIVAAVRGYLSVCAVPDSTQAVLDTVIAQIG